MKQIYFSSTYMWNSSLEEIVKTAYKYGLGGIELWAQQVEYNQYCMEEYISLTNEYHLNTTIHSKSWDLNFASINEGIRRASIEEIKKSIRLAKQIRAKSVTVHPPRETICGLRPFHLELAYQGIKELYRYSCEMEIELSLEILEKIPKELITSAQSLYEVTRDLYDKLSYTLDIAHCTDTAEFFAYLKRIPRISKLHISNKMGNKLHTPLKRGDFNFSAIIPLLEKSDIPMVIEGFSNEAPYLDLLENLDFIKMLKEKELCQ